MREFSNTIVRKLPLLRCECIATYKEYRVDHFPFHHHRPSADQIAVSLFTLSFSSSHNHQRLIDSRSQHFIHNEDHNLQIRRATKDKIHDTKVLYVRRSITILARSTTIYITYFIVSFTVRLCGGIKSGIRVAPRAIISH